MLGSIIKRLFSVTTLDFSGENVHPALLACRTRHVEIRNSYIAPVDSLVGEGRNKGSHKVVPAVSNTSQTRHKKSSASSLHHVFPTHQELFPSHQHRFETFITFPSSIPRKNCNGCSSSLFARHLCRRQGRERSHQGLPVRSDAEPGRQGPGVFKHCFIHTTTTDK